MNLKLKVYAKLNLSLDITGIREDGYHLLDTVMTSISLADTITFKKRQDRRINISYLNGENYPRDIAKKAGDMLVKEYGFFGADIVIEKNIPEKSGLGGSSADASGVIFGLSRLNGCDIEAVRLEDILSVGSDVYYMLYGGLRRVFGVGDIISTSVECQTMDFLLLTDTEGVDTKKSYQSYNFGFNRFDNKSLMLELVRNDPVKAAVFFKNALYDSSRLLNSYIDEKTALLSDCDCRAFMTGSGSGVAGFFLDKAKMEEAYCRIKSDTNRKFEVFCVNSRNNGIEILE